MLQHNHRSKPSVRCTACDVHSGLLVSHASAAVHTGPLVSHASSAVHVSIQDIRPCETVPDAIPYRSGRHLHHGQHGVLHLPLRIRPYRLVGRHDRAVRPASHAHTLVRGTYRALRPSHLQPAEGTTEFGAGGCILASNSRAMDPGVSPISQSAAAARAGTGGRPPSCVSTAHVSTHTFRLGLPHTYCNGNACPALRVFVHDPVSHPVSHPAWAMCCAQEVPPVPSPHARAVPVPRERRPANRDDSDDPPPPASGTASRAAAVVSPDHAAIAMEVERSDEDLLLTSGSRTRGGRS